MKRRARTRATLVALVGAGILGGLAFAESSTEEEAARGAVTFSVYCSNCHGRAGKGDGKLAKLLVHSPTNLTLLAKKNGGTFPAQRVRRVIDGRDEVAEHGERDMPVWGQKFQENAGADKEAAAKAKIDDLVSYVASIQAPAETKKP